MNAGAVTFMAIAVVLLIVLPRRTAVVPLLLAAAYTTRLPVVELGPANLSVLRILILVGFARALGRGEWISNGVNAVDRLVFLWAAVLLGLSAFHMTGAWTFRSGLVLAEVGVYVLCRIFIQDAEDVRRLFKILCVTLVPLAVLLVMEKYAAHNYFGVVGGLEAINVRGGRVRAYGPFAHPILAGTVGATCVPMALCLWRSHRASALIGLAAALAIVFASTSSGPVMMVVFTCIGLLMWNMRNALPVIRSGVVVAIIVLHLVMQDPVYFLMARIDITGGSTGWHRAELIRSSLEHFGEWWAVGTDYTRHWMPTGIHANEFHTDITNHFLGIGVMGGLPLLIVFLLVLTAAFRVVAARLRENEGQSPQRAFLIWTLGAMLFGQIVNFWSISLFDQSVSFFYLVLAAISAIQPVALAAAKETLPSVAVSASSAYAPIVPAAAAWRNGRAARPAAPVLGVARRTDENRVDELGVHVGKTVTRAGKR